MVKDLTVNDDTLAPPTTPPAATTNNKAPAATTKSIITFILVTTSIWLSESILSLIDTSTVGLSATSINELAALGPATMMIDSLLYLSAFLYTSTTNLLASEKAACVVTIADDEPPPTDCKPETSKVVSDAIGVALLIGAFITATVNLFGSNLLLFFFSGNCGEFAKILPSAMKYCRIRSLVAPLSVVGIVAQAALLANGNKITPVLAVATSALLNLVLDLVLVCVFKQGLAGAAIATALANLGSTAVLAHRIRKDNSSTEKLSTIPNAKRLVELITFAGPIFGVMVGKLVSFSMLSLFASNYGLLNLASHNILLKILFFFTTFGDSLSQVSQTYLPGVIASNSKSNNLSLAGFLKISLLLSASFGAFCGCSSLFATKLGRLFTPSKAISSIMATCSKPMLLSLILHPPVMLLEGLLISQRHLTFLLGSYVVSFATILLLLTNSSGLPSIWYSLVGFQCVRLAQFLFKSSPLLKRGFNGRNN